MYKFLLFLITTLLIFSLFACSNNDETSDVESSSDINNSTEDVSTDEPITPTVINSLNYSNPGRMGDTDGPAFAVYSKKGYSAASAVLDIPSVRMKNTMPDGKYLNGYSFLGIDVYDGDYWLNCIDAGLCWSGVTGGWHVFYNIYEPLNPSTVTWYESSRKLPLYDTYLMKLELVADNYAKLTVVGQTTGVKDEVLVEVKGAKKDGSNTAMLFNSALDFPPNTKVDRYGNPSENWTEITLANTDKGVQFKSFSVTDLKLFKGEQSIPWTNDKTSSLSIWPDKKVVGFDYAPTEVTLYDGTKYLINFDMNRWE